MEKKFALLTAQMKSEKRFSRRMEYRNSINVANATNQLQNNILGNGATSKADDTLSNISNTSSFPVTAHHGIMPYHGSRHGLPLGHRKSLGHYHHGTTGLVVDGGILRGGQVASSTSRVPVVVQRHSASCRYRDRSRGQNADDISHSKSNHPTQMVSVIDSQTRGAASDNIENVLPHEIDSSNQTNVNLLSATSGPSLQSFPLDETCVYSNNQIPTASDTSTPNTTHYGVHCQPVLHTSSSSSSTASSSPRIIGNQFDNRESSPHGAQHQKQKRSQALAPPNVPRRTISRLTSAESATVNPTAALTQLTSSPESSSTIISVSPGTAKQPQPKQSPSASISSNTSVNSAKTISSSHQSSPQVSNKSTSGNAPCHIGKQQHALSIPIHHQSQQHKHGYLVSDVVDCRVTLSGNTSTSTSKTTIANNRSISQVTNQNKNSPHTTHLYRSNSASSSTGIPACHGVGHHTVAPSEMTTTPSPAIANTNFTSTNSKTQQHTTQPVISNSYTVNEVIRKRHYRTGLNIFNKKPEKGITYLIRRGFLENSPQAVARFLITRKGLSKQMIGEYLGNLMYAFNMAVLGCFANEVDFAGMPMDAALRKFQTYFRMPGEAQKIERLMEIFSSRYCQCNPEEVAKLHSSDTLFILAFAIILLNTDLHTPNIKVSERYYQILNE